LSYGPTMGRPSAGLAADDETSFCRIRGQMSNSFAHPPAAKCTSRCNQLCGCHGCDVCSRAPFRAKHAC